MINLLSIRSQNYIYKLARTVNLKNCIPNLFENLVQITQRVSNMILLKPDMYINIIGVWLENLIKYHEFSE